MGVKCSTVLLGGFVYYVYHIALHGSVSHRIGTALF